MGVVWTLRSRAHRARRQLRQGKGSRRAAKALGDRRGVARSKGGERLQDSLSVCTHETLSSLLGFQHESFIVTSHTPPSHPLRLCHCMSSGA